MKRIHPILYCVFLLLTGCSYQGVVYFDWNPISGNLFVNQQEVDYSPYELETPEGTTVTVEFIPNRTEGWLFEGWLFTDPLVPVSLKSQENPHEFIADYEHRNVKVHAQQYEIIAFSNSLTETKIFMKIYSPSINYFIYDISKDSFTPLSISNDQFAYVEDQNLIIEEKTTGSIYYYAYDEISEDLVPLAEIAKSALLNQSFLYESPDYTEFIQVETNHTLVDQFTLINDRSETVCYMVMDPLTEIRGFFWNSAGSRRFICLNQQQTNRNYLYEIKTEPTLSLSLISELPYHVYRETCITDQDDYGYLIIDRRGLSNEYSDMSPSLFIIDLNTGVSEIQTPPEKDYYYDSFFRHDGRVYINTESELVLLSGFQRESIFNYTDEGFLEGDFAKPLFSQGEFLVRSRIHQTNDLYRYNQNTGVRTRITTPERILPLLETGE